MSDIAEIIQCPIKTQARISSVGGRTGSIVVLFAQKTQPTSVDRRKDQERQSEVVLAWSYALHHIIKSAQKEEIVGHIAKYAVNPLYKNYPNYMLHDDLSARFAYQQARESYIKDEALPIYRKLKEAQKQHDLSASQNPAA